MTTVSTASSNSSSCVCAAGYKDASGSCNGASHASAGKPCSLARPAQRRSLLRCARALVREHHRRQRARTAPTNPVWAPARVLRAQAAPTRPRPRQRRPLAACACPVSRGPTADHAPVMLAWPCAASAPSAAYGRYWPGRCIGVGVRANFPPPPDVVCNGHPFVSRDVVVACPLGTYKSSLGSAACTSCPSNSNTTVTGATSVATCACAAGYGGLNATLCTACGLGTYKSAVANTACSSCASDSSTATTASTSSSACLCNAGYSGPNGGACAGALFFARCSRRGTRPVRACALTQPCPREARAAVWRRGQRAPPARTRWSPGAHPAAPAPPTARR